MEKFLTIYNNEQAAATEIQAYQLACRETKQPCIIITMSKGSAAIACDNWLCNGCLPITLKDKQRLENRLKRLLKTYRKSGIELTTTKAKASVISNPIPLWYIFNHIPPEQAEEIAETIFNTYQGTLQFAF